MTLAVVACAAAFAARDMDNLDGIVVTADRSAAAITTAPVFTQEGLIRP